MAAASSIASSSVCASAAGSLSGATYATLCRWSRKTTMPQMTCALPRDVSADERRRTSKSRCSW